MDTQLFYKRPRATVQGERWRVTGGARWRILVADEGCVCLIVLDKCAKSKYEVQILKNHFLALMTPIPPRGY